MNSYIGTVLYGYCNGFFGRDSYSDKVIEAQGKDWIVARTTDAYADEFPVFCSFVGWEDQMDKLISDWSKKDG